MQLTSSLSAFNGENDFNYFIETTQNMPIQSKQSDNHVFNYSYEYNIHDQKPIHDYIAKLEKKIIIQTKKLSELEKYKYKCEQFIKKTNPYQILPITDEMLSNNYEIIKDPINAAEQRNYIDLLKKTIENELIKNGLLNQNIKVEEIIDFAKIKLENEECKKQLVLAHSMINSLKSDLVELTKENEEYKINKDKNLSIKNNESININNEHILNINQKLINYKENYEKINEDFEKLMNEKKQIKKENNKLKNEIIKYKEQTIKLNKELDNNILNNKSNINIIDDEEKNELILENEKLKESLENLTIKNNKLEKENKINKNKIIELNDKHKIDKEKLFQEINKLIKENRIIKEKELNSGIRNYIIEDTEEENKKMKTIPLNNNNKEINNLIKMQKKYDDLNIKYSILNKKYESLLNKYGKNIKEQNKINELFNKRNISKDNKINEFKNLFEKLIETNNKNNYDININDKKDSFEYNKIKFILWEMDNEINEKNKIISENKYDKNVLENEVAIKFKYYDEYISNNKSKIKILLNQLFNLLILFKEKHESLTKDNESVDYISHQFLIDIDKIINQINAINNLTNYDIELDDNIFFETIKNFMDLLSQEIILIYTKSYNYKKYNFHHRSKSEVTKNVEELFPIKNSKEDCAEIIKESKQLKKQNHFYFKENIDLKNKLNDINNKLNEFILKYNHNQKTVSICNEGKKNLLNIMFKFIKNVNDNDFIKIMYDILTITEQINLIQINKCLVEEKLNIILKNNEDLNEEYSNNLEEHLLKEINKLKKLIEDYNNLIDEKNEILKNLKDDYLKKEELYSNNIQNMKEKNIALTNEKEESNNKIISLEKEIKEHEKNKISDNE